MPIGSERWRPLAHTVCILIGLWLIHGTVPYLIQAENAGPWSPFVAVPQAVLASYANESDANCTVCCFLSWVAIIIALENALTFFIVAITLAVGFALFCLIITGIVMLGLRFKRRNQ